MWTTTFRTAMAAGLPLLLAGSLASGPPQRAHFSGTMTLDYAEQHAMSLGDPAQPVLLQNKAQGTNRNTGSTDYMDGAQVTNLEIADLTQGNGPNQGYITFSKDGEITQHRWRGTVKTVLAADGKTPITTFDGAWTTVSGTGRYEGVTGKGRYRGRMVSPTGMTIDWEGELILKEKTAAR